MTLMTELNETSPRSCSHPVLSAFWDDARVLDAGDLPRHDGYQGLRKALAMAPDDVIASSRTPDCAAAAAPASRPA